MLAKAVIVLVSSLFLISCGRHSVAPTANPATLLPPTQLTLVEQWGIEAQGIKLSAAGYMLDFRYKVINPVKAAIVVNRKDKPYLLDDRSKMIVRVPAPANIGPLRHTGGNLKKDTTYFVLFSNPGKRINQGDQVTVVMGQYKLEHITVE